MFWNNAMYFSSMKDALGNREAAADCHGFPARTERAARNMLENMVLFTALALVAVVGNVSDPNVELGARIFYWARLAYIPIYMCTGSRPAAPASSLR